MSSENFSPQSPQSYSRQLNIKDKFLVITSLSGEFPFQYTKRIGFTHNYIKNVRSRLYKEQLIKNKNEDNLKGLVLTSDAMDVMKDTFPNRYKYLDDKNRTESGRRYRKQLFALTYCSLVNADIEFLPDKKPFIFSRSRSQSYSEVSYPLIQQSMLTDVPIFYSSIEIKYELEDYVQQIRNSAMMGIILSNSECFALYNYHENKYPPPFATEVKAGIYISSGTFRDGEDSPKAIILISDLELAADLILGNAKKKIKPDKVLNSTTIYDSIYVVPENSDGDIQLQMLVNKKLRQLIDNTMAKNFKSRNPNYIIVNDGIDSDGLPVINGCHLDITKLMQFKQGLLSYNLTGRILCYDFQKSFIEKLMGKAKRKFNTINTSSVRKVIGT